MVSARPVQLQGRAIVIITQKVAQRIASAHQVRIEPVIAEMTGLAAAGALPARLESGTTPRLLLYTQHHVVKLNPSDSRDAYRLNHISPLTFRDQEKLLTGALLLNCPEGWYPLGNVRQLPQDLPRNWDRIEHEWQAMLAQPHPQRLPSAHAQYLDLLEHVVEAARDIELERQRGAEPVAYRRRGSTRESRYSARGVYEFDLLQRAPFGTSTPIQVGDDPQLRGRVTFLEGLQITVRLTLPSTTPGSPPRGP